MKIIDFEIKGTMVKFYLGKDSLKKWWGDDWNDRPYEHNAGTVYDEFVSKIVVKVFDFDDIVLEPSDGEINSAYTKEDMVKRHAPCVIVLGKKYLEEYSDGALVGYSDVINHEHCIKYYFGDKIKA